MTRRWSHARIVTLADRPLLGFPPSLAARLKARLPGLPILFLLDELDADGPVMAWVPLQRAARFG
jgi:hypothetical protein